MHRRFLKLFFSSFKMGENGETIHNSREKLSNLIRTSSNKDAAVQQYFSEVKFPPVEDFKRGFEWFNVSEPLSFSKHLKGKVVVLDFFTYCCINCMHIIPELRELESEFSVEDGLVVIGVHSAKFDNEKVSNNILAAVQRYNISHPVVNDYEAHMWKNCDVHCWPTVLMLGPDGNPLVMLMGEGHKEELRLYIKNALIYYKSQKKVSNHSLPIELAYHLLPELKGPLLFPGKIASHGELLAISDSGNNRILIIANDGRVLHQIGSGLTGFEDGSLGQASFNNPQGLVFYNKDILYVADTENHAIRKIDLKDDLVETVAGTGFQGNDRIGGNNGKVQELSSPWDVCLYKTENSEEVLLIAIAGIHQIWALFLTETVWWKKKFVAGSCACIAGSGSEENRNNSYPSSAAFAQPSGLALSYKRAELYIADSESSTVRRLSLKDGKVAACVGGDRNPRNLFAFGDVDGKLFEAKLQHPLGLALSPDEDVLFVSDTYNHKIKKIDVSENAITTLNRIDEIFKEPAGLCVTGNSLYIADTNNHAIKKINLTDFTIIEKLNLKFEKLTKKIKSQPQTVINKPLVVNAQGGKLILKINLNFKNVDLTVDAPQRWSVELPNSSWSCVPKSGNNIHNVDVVVSVPKLESPEVLEFVFQLIVCAGDSCAPKKFAIQQPIQASSEGLIALEEVIKVCVEPSDLKLV